MEQERHANQSHNFPSVPRNSAIAGGDVYFSFGVMKPRRIMPKAKALQENPDDTLKPRLGLKETISPNYFKIAGFVLN
jgi:hypothetical protein